MINNQQGSTLLSGLLMLLFVSLGLLIHLYYQSYYYKRLDTHLTKINCFKEYLGAKREYIYQVGRLNWMIDNVDTAKWIALVIPGMQGAALNIHRARQIMQKVQFTYHVLYMKKITPMIFNECRLSPFIVKRLPYQMKAGFLSFKRNLKGVAKLKKRTWKESLRTPILSYRFKFRLNSAKDETLKMRIR